MTNKQTELDLIVREKGSDNIQVKIINEEIEEVENKLRAMGQKKDKDQDKFKDCIAKRDQIRKMFEGD